MTTLNTEIRKLPVDQFCELVKILNLNDSWKEVMAAVLKCDNQKELLFKNEHVTMIEQSMKILQRTGAEIFLSEWGSVGKPRPTCGTLLDVLVKIKLFRAADYLAVNILKIDRPERPKTGPAAPVALLKSDLIKFERKVSDLIQFSKSINEQLPEDMSDLIKFSSEVSDINVQTEDFTLCEARSENIPLCVKEETFVN